jgi:hypothetical protein
MTFVAIDALWWPMGFDQGVFAWAGDVIVSGGLPYRDAWEVKSPATHYICALAQLVFGRTMWGIRVVDLFFLVVGLLALWSLLRRAGVLAQQYTVLIFAATYLSQGYWNTAQPDGWATILVVLALAVLAVARGPWPRALAGFLVGLAALLKLPFLALAIPLAAFELLREADNLRRGFRRLLPLVTSTTALLLFCAAWFAWQGGLEELVEIQFKYNPQIHQGLHFRELNVHLAAFSKYLVSERVLAMQYPLIALGVLQTWRQRRALAIALALFILSALMLVVMQNKYYRYHWIPVYAPLMILAGFGVSEAQRLLAKLSARMHDRFQLMWIVLLIALGVVLSRALPTLELGGWSTFVLGRMTPSYYYSQNRFVPGSIFSPVTDMRVARYLTRTTDPDDGLVIWGSEPVVNYLSGRRSPTRFGYNNPLIASKGTDFYARYRREFLRDLVNDPPAYFIVMDRDQNNLMRQPSLYHFEQFHQLVSFVHQNYTQDRQIRHFQLWRRKTP